jgi:hypothetical protein
MANTYTYFQRTAGSDYNNAADFNTINKSLSAIVSTNGTAAPTEALDQKFSVTNVLNASSTATDKVFSANYVTDNFGSGVGSDFSMDFPAGSWDFYTTFAPWEKETGTNGDLYIHRFDDTTEEIIQSQFKLPEGIQGTATFYVDGLSATAAASKNVRFRFYHSAKTAGEAWDASYATLNSGDMALNSTTGEYDQLSFTESVTNLGWSAMDNVRIRLSRVDASANDLSGDYKLVHFRIRVPRA